MPMTGLLTGIARYLRNLYTAMGRMDSVELSFFNGTRMSHAIPTKAVSGKRQAALGVVRNLPDPVLFGLRAALWLKYEHGLERLCRKKGMDCFDLYHETAFTPAKFTGVPTVYSLYDLCLRRFRQTQPKERVWLFEHFIKTRLKYARHILTISEFVRQEIIWEFKVPPSMVTAIPLAPDPVFVPAPPGKVQAVLDRYNLPADYLVFVSSLEPRKNIDLLIHALEKTNSDIPLVLVGWEGWGTKGWLSRLGSAALKNRIYFTGHVPDMDLTAIYTGALALIYPSLYEGFGLPIVEAMACGCPVICSNTASMPEVAGDAAVLIDPLDSDDLAGAIDLVVHDTSVRNNLVVKGFQQAGKFTWDSTAEKTLKLFEQVAK